MPPCQAAAERNLVKYDKRSVPTNSTGIGKFQFTSVLFVFESYCLDCSRALEEYAI